VQARRHIKVVEHYEEEGSARNALRKLKECARHKEVSISISEEKSLSAKRAKEIIREVEG
jgi:hypothetical protein